MIAIDSKFPLEVIPPDSAGRGRRRRTPRAAVGVHRAVRDRIDESRQKYISPEDGTLDFALMYIPSESIYYEIAVRDRGTELLDYARERARGHMLAQHAVRVSAGR